jgi:hypothetical protein
MYTALFQTCYTTCKISYIHEDLHKLFCLHNFGERSINTTHDSWGVEHCYTTTVDPHACQCATSSIFEIAGSLSPIKGKACLNSFLPLPETYSCSRTIGRSWNDIDPLHGTRQPDLSTIDLMMEGPTGASAPTSSPTTAGRASNHGPPTWKHLLQPVTYRLE